MAKNFIRFVDTIEKREEKAVASITVKLLISDCTGTIWVTDIMAQEGGKLTGYAGNILTLSKRKIDGSPTPPVFFNGVIRSEYEDDGVTIVYPNKGTESTGLDLYIDLHHALKKNHLAISQNSGAQKAIFTEAANAGDKISFLASSRQCLKNGEPIEKRGFFQYSAAGDNKQVISLTNGNFITIWDSIDENGNIIASYPMYRDYEAKSAHVLLQLQEMEETGEVY